MDVHSRRQRHSDPLDHEFKPLRRRCQWLVRHMLAPLWRPYMQAGVEAAARVAEGSEVIDPSNQKDWS